MAPEATALLASRAWPGNVRELEHVLERAVVMAPGPVIGPGDLGLDRGSETPDALDYHATVQTAVGGTERALIERALAECGNNRTRAAKLLGIGRRTLLYKLKRYGI